MGVLQLVADVGGFVESVGLIVLLVFYYFLCCLFDKLWCLFVLVLVFDLLVAFLLLLCMVCGVFGCFVGWWIVV